MLTHPTCNRSKSDTLAARDHLARWREYTHKHSDDLNQITADASRAGDLQTSLSITRWGHGNAASSGAMAWKRSREYEVVTLDYLDLLVA